MREIKWSRDEAGNRIWTGTRATYRVASLTGPWEVQVHPPEGVEPDDVHDDRDDSVLLTLAECKVFIDSCEEVGDIGTAYELTVMWRNMKKAR